MASAQICMYHIVFRTTTFCIFVFRTSYFCFSRDLFELSSLKISREILLFYSRSDRLPVIYHIRVFKPFTVTYFCYFDTIDILGTIVTYLYICCSPSPHNTFQLTLNTSVACVWKSRGSRRGRKGEFERRETRDERRTNISIKNDSYRIFIIIYPTTLYNWYFSHLHII